jgi:hypothetical protein
MFGRALELGELEVPRAVGMTLIAELWRRAGRHDDALASCDAAELELADDASVDEDDGGAPTSAVVAFIRALALAGDDEAHSCAEAFAEGE